MISVTKISPIIAISVSLKKIMNLYNFKDTEIAMIGDILVTDIYGGNKMNFTTILVNSISEREPFSTRILHIFEKYVLKYLNKKELVVKGKYYE